VAKKLYYKIGEACKKLEIQPYVLRYWETEFPFLSPNKSKSGQRVYSDHELGVIRRIKELLYEEGYTIAGAKKKLEGEMAAEAEADPAAKTEAEGEPAAPSKPATGRGRRVEPAKKKGSEADGKAEEYRHGIETALRQAQEILEALQSGPSRSGEAA
jgi:DNA-binding transcriptional MerR regulator